MNILLSSIGQHVYMAKIFHEALAGRGELHVANANDQTAAFQYADKHIVVPRSYEDNYIDTILQYCIDNKIELVIPFMDVDLKPLSANKARFKEHGITVLVADYDFIDICCDKWKTYCFLVDNGINTARSYLDINEVLAELEAGTISYPVMVKARFGAGSMGLYTAHDEKELREANEQCCNTVSNTHIRFTTGDASPVIFQALLPGDEHVVDIINDLNGNHRSTVVRRKYYINDGERTRIAKIVEIPAIAETAEKISSISKHIGNLDCDFFYDGKDAYVLEFNPRFGGGFPLSHMAGVKLPEALIEWCSGNEVDDSTLKAALGDVVDADYDLSAFVKLY